MTNTCSEILYSFALKMFTMYAVIINMVYQYGVAQLVTDPPFADTTTIKKTQPIAILTIHSLTRSIQSTRFGSQIIAPTDRPTESQKDIATYRLNRPSDNYSEIRRKNIDSCKYFFYQFDKP